MKHLYSTLLLVLLCAVYGFSKSDTVYVDNHVVTYIKPEPVSSNKADVIPDSIFDSWAKNYISLYFEPFSINFGIVYERLLTSRASAFTQLAYRSEAGCDTISSDHTEGSIKAFELGIGGRLYLFNNNFESKSIGVTSKITVHNSHGGIYLQMQLSPTIAKVDFSRQPSEEKAGLILNGNEFALFLSLGAGYTYAWEHLFVSATSSFKKLIVQPRWIKDVEYKKDEHFEHPLFNKTAMSFALNIGRAF